MRPRPLHRLCRVIECANRPGRGGSGSSGESNDVYVIDDSQFLFLRRQNFGYNTKELRNLISVVFLLPSLNLFLLVIH